LRQPNGKESGQCDSQQREQSENARHVIHLAYDNFSCRFIKATLYLVQC
jgi:hypothetical protein